MTNIFISHSQQDSKIKNFFNEIFANSKIHAIFEEFDLIKEKKIDTTKIEQDINSSDAIFMLLSENTDILAHTRDWVVWESGRSANKEIWLFIPEEINLNLSIVIPKFSHLVLYNFSNSWKKYISQIIEAYDNSDYLPASLLSSGIGTAIGGASYKKNRTNGAIMGSLFGLLGGLFISHLIKTKIPNGIEITCENCESKYIIHAKNLKFRCPVCNSHLNLIKKA